MSDTDWLHYYHTPHCQHRALPAPGAPSWPCDCGLEAAIEQELNEARIDELEKQLLLTGHSALTRRNIHERIKALQANKEKL